MAELQSQTKEEDNLTLTINNNVDSIDKPNQRKEPIYVMTIELDQGKPSYIEIYADSVPEEVSYDFCRKNNLDYQSLNYLRKQIEELIEQNNQLLPPKPQSKANIPKEKDEGVQVAVTPIKSSLFSCESFFVTLLERNSSKHNKNNNTRRHYIPLTKQHSKTDTLNNKTFISDSEKNKYSTPLHTDANQNNKHKHYYPIPHPIYNKTESSPKGKMTHCDSEKCSKLSNNYFNESYSRSNSQLKKNIGVRLYEKGNELLEKKNKRIAEMRNNLALKTEVELTFKPLIHYNSSSFLKEKNKSATEKELNRKNSFKPLPKSNSLIKMHSNGNSLPSLIKTNEPQNSNAHSKSQPKLKTKSPKSNSELNYQPHLTQYHLTEKTKLTFSSRLKLFQKKYEENNSKLKMNFTKNIDIKTGQPYFMPALISKQQKKSKSPLNKNSNIFEDLYSYASYYKSNQNKRKEIIDQEVVKLKKLKISDNTEDLYQKKKESVFKYIFKLFDTDEDGSISIYSIDLNKLPNHIVSIIMPIITDLKEFQGTIDCNDFVIEGMKLFEVSIVSVYYLLYY